MIADARPSTLTAAIAFKASLVFVAIGMLSTILGWIVVGVSLPRAGPLLWSAALMLGLHWYTRKPRSHGVLVVLMVVQSVLAIALFLVDFAPFPGPVYILSIVASALFLRKPWSFIVAGLMTLVTIVCGTWFVEFPPPMVEPQAWWLIMPSMVGFTAGAIIQGSLRGRHEAEALAANHSRINSLLEKQLDVADEIAGGRERARIARELHDSLGHCLTTSLLYIELVERHLTQSANSAQSAQSTTGGTAAASEDDPASTALSKVRETTERGLAELRRCVALLRSQTDNQSLADSLRELAEHFPIEVLDVQVAVEGDERQLEASREFALFRTAQEALTNAVKHAGATSVELRLCYRSDEVELVATDNGAGCAEPIMGFGLQGIRERLASIGGALSIASQPGQGYTLRASVQS